MPLPPGFAEIPDPTVSVGKPPSGFSEVSDQPDWGGIVKDALNEAQMGNGSKIRNLMIDPITQAKVLPYMANAAGMVGLGAGATANTAGAHLLSDAALKSYGREDQIPPLKDQAIDIGTAALGDTINSSLAGRAIGKAEKAANVITRAPLKLPTPSNVGTVLDELETTLKQSLVTGKPLGPQSARDAYAVAKYVAGNPNIVGKSDEIAVQAARVRSMASAALNQAVPGRAAPAAAMATAKTVPNIVGKIGTAVNQTLPWWAKGAMAITGGDALLNAFRGHNK